MAFLELWQKLSWTLKGEWGKKALALLRETLIFLNSKGIGELKVRII